MSCSRRSLDVDSLSHIRGIPYQRTLSLRYMLHFVPAEGFTQVNAEFHTGVYFHSGIRGIPYHRTLSLRYMWNSLPAHAFTQLYVAFLASARFYSDIRGIPSIVHIFTQVFMVNSVQHTLTHALTFKYKLSLKYVWYSIARFHSGKSSILNQGMLYSMHTQDAFIQVFGAFYS